VLVSLYNNDFLLGLWLVVTIPLKRLSFETAMIGHSLHYRQTASKQWAFRSAALLTTGSNAISGGIFTYRTTSCVMHEHECVANHDRMEIEDSYGQHIQIITEIDVN